MFSISKPSPARCVFEASGQVSDLGRQLDKGGALGFPAALRSVISRANDHIRT